jgi:integrase/recombinase XerD
LADEGVALEALSRAEVERFSEARRAAGYTNYLTPKALAPLLGYLRGLGVVPPPDAPVLSPAEVLLERYRGYLMVERGLAAERRAATWTWRGRSSLRASAGAASSISRD